MSSISAASISATANPAAKAAPPAPSTQKVDSDGDHDNSAPSGKAASPAASSRALDVTA